MQSQKQRFLQNNFNTNMQNKIKDFAVKFGSSSTFDYKGEGLQQEGVSTSKKSGSSVFVNNRDSMIISKSTPKTMIPNKISNNP